MSVLKSLVNKEVNQCCPLFDDYLISFELDKSGAKVSTFKRVDYPEIIKSNGFVNHWNLDSLLKAGINPESLSISTRAIDRLSGQSSLDDVVNEVMPEIENVIVESDKSE